MKTILQIFMSFILVLSLGGPSYAFEDRCLAVFCNTQMENFWPSLKPDVLVVATSWEQFDDFLAETKAKAHGRPVLIDLDLHGSGRFLCLKTEDFRTGKTIISAAGWGFVANHLEKYFAGQDLIVVCESCFSGETYHNSIRGNKIGENHPGVPAFPIYGGSYNKYNLNNLVYMQYITGCHVWFEDIRKWDEKKGPARLGNERDPEYEKMYKLYIMLAALYTPDMPKP